MVDWANIFFKLGHYLGFDKHKVWELTLPQLSYYLEQCDEHIDFTIKVSTMGLGAMFGGVGEVESNGSGSEQRPDGEYIDGYKVADVEDLNWLAQLL